MAHLPNAPGMNSMGTKARIVVTVAANQSRSAQSLEVTAGQLHIGSDASLAVGAKGLALRFAGEESQLAYRVHRGIEILGAFVVLLLGLVLLIAALGWG